MTLAAVPRPEERLSPLERLEALCDPGSLHVIRTAVTSPRMGGDVRRGDGVVAGSGRVDGRPVLCYAQDPSYAGGSLGEAHADTIVRVLGQAARARAPVVGFVESSGARLQEGTAALAGYARIFAAHVRLAAVVPQVTIVTGASAGGGAYAPALTDFVVMTESATMFLTGPRVVAEVTGEQLTAPELGGSRVHARSGVAHLTAPTEVDAALAARELLDYLPQHAGAAVAPRPARAPAETRPDRHVPDDPRRVYDVRDVIRALADGGGLLEVQRGWARNLVCGFARLGGRAVGIVANQPRHLGGVLDAESSQKGACFVRTCDAFGLPLLVLVDTPGFLPGGRQERAGVIRHGATLVHAFAAATVPKLTVVLRKAFGGAFIAMNAKDLGADLVVAWPSAELGVMGARQAVGIVHRREIAAADDGGATARRLARDYAEQHLRADAAARLGAIDEVIAPDETRDRLAAALDALSRTAGR